MAPTLLYSMSLPIPGDFEGKIVAEAYEKDFLKNNPIEIGDSTLSEVDAQPADPANRLKEGDESQIMERLKMLGYFG